MKCQKCRAENTTDYKYCAECGKKPNKLTPPLTRKYRYALFSIIASLVIITVSLAILSWQLYGDLQEQNEKRNELSRQLDSTESALMRLKEVYTINSNALTKLEQFTCITEYGDMYHTIDCQYIVGAEKFTAQQNVLYLNRSACSVCGGLKRESLGIDLNTFPDKK